MHSFGEELLNSIVARKKNNADANYTTYKKKVSFMKDMDKAPNGRLIALKIVALTNVVGEWDEILDFVIYRLP